MPDEVIDKTVFKIKQKLSNMSLLFADFITDIDEKINMLIVHHENDKQTLQITLDELQIELDNMKLSSS